MEPLKAVRRLPLKLGAILIFLGFGLPSGHVFAKADCGTFDPPTENTSVNGKGDEVWQQFAYASARERFEKSREHMKSLLARISVLQALREGRPASPSQSLIDLVGESEAKQLLEQASRFAKAEQKKLQAEEEIATSIIEALERGRDVLQDSVARADEATKQSTGRMTALNEATKDGYVTNTSMDVARNNLAQSLMNLQAARASLAQVEESLSKATKEKDLISITAKVEEEKEFAADLAAINEEQATQTTIGQFVSGMDCKKWHANQLTGALAQE